MINLKWIFLSVFWVAIVACQPQMNEQYQQSVQQARMKKTAELNAQLGLGYLAKGNTARARQKLFYAVSLDKHSPDIYAALAYFFEKTGDKSNAQQYYQKALALAPTRGEHLNNYGAFLCRQGEYREAERYFMRAVADVQYIHSAGAYENAGLCQLSAKNSEKALQYFRLALQQDPERLPSLAEATKILMKKNAYADALGLLEQYPQSAHADRALLQEAITASIRTGRTDSVQYYQNLLGETYPPEPIAGAQHEHNTTG